jgi:LDH2 family malate/lactate/ureidoglycolate dehydrogenase
MISVSMTNVLASMPPTGGAEAYIGNNAYSMAFPTKDEPSVVVDGATSLASWGKVFLCAQEGKDLPDGCYVDGIPLNSVMINELKALAIEAGVPFNL